MGNNSETYNFQCCGGLDIYEPYIQRIQEKVCQDLPFYAEHEGNQYCVLHYPSYEKEFDFEVVLQERLVKKDYDFEGVLFPNKLNLSNYNFENDVNFTFAEFADDVDFSFSTFSKDVLFQATRFWQQANFFSATFLNETNFNSASFVKKANFWKSIFGEKSKVLFHGSRFHEDANFFSTEIKNNISFRGLKTNINYENESESKDYLNLCFGQNAYLNFEDAQIEHPERIFFDSVRLHPAWFLNVNPKKFVLTNIHWENADGTPKGIQDEMDHLRKRQGTKLQNTVGSLAIIYRQLAANAEENSQHEDASRFRAMVIEAESLEKKNKGLSEPLYLLRFRILKTLYDLVEANPSKKIFFEDLEYETQLDFTEVDGALEYLVQHDLIKKGDEWVQITSDGIDQVETAKSRPDRPTKLFPANIINNVTNIFGDNSGNIQTGGQGNTQVNTVVTDQEFTKAVEKLFDIIEKSSLSPLSKIKARSDIQTIKDLAPLEKSLEVVQEAGTRIEAVKKAISITADVSSLGTTLILILQKMFGL